LGIEELTLANTTILTDLLLILLMVVEGVDDLENHNIHTSFKLQNTFKVTMPIELLDEKTTLIILRQPPIAN